MQITAIYPGTFDPFTNGHKDLAHRASRLFSRLIIGIATNSSKTPLFSMEERLEMTKEILKDYKNIEIMTFEGLLTDFAREQNAHALVRGMRAVSDFEFEFQLASMNRSLAPEVESIFLTPTEEYSFLSSSLVREVAMFNGDVSKFVHPIVLEALQDRFNK